MTGGESPERLAASLALLRPLADEIVVGVERHRCRDAARSLEALADRVISFPSCDPADRAIPWLFSQCDGEWILNLDDDEVPSRALLEHLPGLLVPGVTHAWIARRWLYPTEARHLDEPPWRPDYQLRLVRRDDRFVQFSDEFHRPVVAIGPATFVDAPLWHLDCVVHPFEQRREKALAYERARGGMRVGGISHNAGFYLPELHPGARTAAVPGADVAVIEGVIAGDRAQTAPVRTMVREGSAEEVDAAWPGPPYDASLYSARLRLLHDVPSVITGVQHTVDVVVENLSGATWRWGEEARPEIRLSYHWFSEDGAPVEGASLRTPLPADLPPGSALLVPVHVVAPESQGRHRLEIDLLHEHVRWFGVGVHCDVDVLPKRRIAVSGASARVEAALDAIALVPEWEPELLLPDSGVPPRRLEHPRIQGFRSYLLNDLHARRPVAVGQLVVRTARLLRTARSLARGGPARSLPRPTIEALEELASCDRLVVAGADWEAEAAPRRELWRVVATVLAARTLGLEVLLVDPFGRANGSPAERLLLAVLRERARVLAGDGELPSLLADLGTP